MLFPITSLSTLFSNTHSMLINPDKLQPYKPIVFKLLVATRQGVAEFSRFFLNVVASTHSFDTLLHLQGVQKVTPPYGGRHVIVFFCPGGEEH
jgi:hypothetical protein